MSLDVQVPGDWRSWDEVSKDRLLARLKAETLIQEKIASYCEDETPSAMARRWLGDRWHHRSYHDVLDQLALDLESGVVDRATISMPPQVGKSTWVNWLVFWSMARHPLDPLIRMSYAAELATTHARFVQGYVEDHGSGYGLLQKRGDWAQHNWHTMTGAGLRSGGMLTGVAGFPAARMVIDDPIGGRALADSKTIRDKTYNEYSANLLSRLRPGGWLLIVNTRWHDDDLNARVVKLEGSRWREINLPAIAWADDDPLGRSIGEPLPHPYIDPDDTAAALKHWEEKRRTSTTRDWFSLYQGDPRPAEGALLTDDQVKASTYNDEIDFTKVKTGVSIDPNGGGRDVAGVIGGCQLDDGTVVWTHDRSGNFGSDGWSTAACVLAHEIDAGVFVYEHNYGGDQARLILRTVWKQLSDAAVERGEDDWGPCPRIEAVHAKKGKRVRAEPISAQVVFGKVKFYGLQVLDLGSEWCFAAGTMVTTSRGDIPIEGVRAGDLAMTRQGWKRVSWSGCTGVRETTTNHFTDGRSVRSTPEHKFWTQDGWVRADSLGSSHRMDTCNLSSTPRRGTSAVELPTPDTSSTKAKTGTGRSTAGSDRDRANDYCIASSGPITTASFSGGSTSTTLTKTGRTTRSGTLKLSSTASTCGTTKPELLADPCPINSDRCAGTGGLVDNPDSCSAGGAGPHSNPTGCGPSTAVFSTGTRTSGRIEPVYDLTVDDAHEFYANGILVHNCTWQEDSKESPGRIDASCYLAYKWLKVPGAEAVVSSIAEKPKQPTGKSRQAAKTFTRGGPGTGAGPRL